MFSWAACWTMFYLGFPSKAHPPLLTENLPPSCQDVRVLGRPCTHSIGRACKKKWTTKPGTALIFQQITVSNGKWETHPMKILLRLVGSDNLRRTGKTFATKTEIWIDSELHISYDYHKCIGLNNGKISVRWNGQWFQSEIHWQCFSIVASPWALAKWSILVPMHNVPYVP